VTRREEQSEATRAALVAAARELFSERGYARVGTEEIVRAAEVTRGALYHHFGDKKDLFRAVHEQLEAEITERVGADLAAAAAAAGPEADPLDALAAGIASFLDACTDPRLARVVLLEAPSVLGWAEWREIDERYGLGLVSAGLQGAMDAGALRPQPVKPLAHLMLGALGEAAMLIANADEPRRVREEVEPPLLALLDGLRAAPG
jgi:AcrR family transcriptional regulator